MKPDESEHPDPAERSRVARVSIELGAQQRQYLDCFISVDPALRTVAIWGSVDSKVPIAMAPIEATLVEWIYLPQTGTPEA